MSKEQLDLLHFQNKAKQLEFLLNEEKEKNKKLLKFIAEAKFALKPWVKRLEKI